MTTSKQPQTSNPHQPRGSVRIEDAEENDFERSQEEVPTDDPGDAQRASKLDEEGDGEEELR